MRQAGFSGYEAQHSSVVNSLFYSWMIVAYHPAISGGGEVAQHSGKQKIVFRKLRITRSNQNAMETAIRRFESYPPDDP